MGPYDDTCSGGGATGGDGAWSDGTGETAVPDDLGDGTSDVLKVPYFSSVLLSTIEASSGSSTLHFRPSTLRMLRVRRAQSQSSASSSRCLTPWMTSLLAVFSGRLRR